MRRLPATVKTDRIDLDRLAREGKVRCVAGSNYEPNRIEEALAIQAPEGLKRWVALQPQDNLVEQADHRERYLRPARIGT